MEVGNRDQARSVVVPVVWAEPVSFRVIPQFEFPFGLVGSGVRSVSVGRQIGRNTQKRSVRGGCVC